MENLETDLPLPPGVLEATVAALETSDANSWLPFTGDPERCARATGSYGRM